MKNLKLSMIIGITVAALLLSSCGSSNDNSNKKSVPKAVKNIVEASGVVKSSKVENIVLDGGAQASIKVTAVDVTQGQAVKKGDKLVELDLTDINAQIAVKKNTIDSDNYLKKDMQSDNQKQAQASKIAAEQADLDALNSKVSSSYLKNGNIISDMDNAVVTDINYQKGDIVSSQLKILSLQDINNVYVQANVGEEFIKDVQVGKPVTIVPTFDPVLKFTGKVTSISKAAVVEKNGETDIPVQISVDNSNGKLLPNYNVDVEISK